MHMTNSSAMPLLDSVLPAPDTKRWSPARKAAVVAAARAGLISREEACRRYRLSDEELSAWERDLDKNGVPGLRTTRLQCYRYTKIASPPRQHETGGQQLRYR
jgi:transposase-like protein